MKYLVLLKAVKFGNSLGNFETPLLTKYYCGYILGQRLEKLGYFSFQHLVTLATGHSLASENWIPALEPVTERWGQLKILGKSKPVLKFERLLRQPLLLRHPTVEIKRFATLESGKSRRIQTSSGQLGPARFGQRCDVNWRRCDDSSMLVQFWVQTLEIANV